jgi:hypothetical protein
VAALAARKDGTGAMLGAAGLVYGVLLSFVYASASQNHKEGRDNPPMVELTGYVLCGISAGLAGLFGAQSCYLIAHHLLTA